MTRSILVAVPAVLLAVCMVLSTGCLQEEEGQEGLPTPPPTPSPAQETTMPVFGPGDNGKNVTLAAGTEFAVQLPENPTTGYTWNMSVPPGLAVARDEFLAPDTRLVGAGGTHRWILSAGEKGAFPLHAEYRRPWVPAGTIVHVPLEGGFFGIAGDDGRNYLPLALGEEFHVDGLRVAFEAEEVPDVATIQMWGTPVNLTFTEKTETFDLLVVVE
ncbi:MAG: protease inhibitor I42 family protein [Methanolinea sp.]